ncbi:photosystem II protein PsbQ [Chamaesiphon sp. VAR_48_metabat_403]|uniref:photosystem II protein PsbQ n=1 Tax=Chamaesiphon sp. VAR_48_metabat_403 TaxID=2964700 RepID=UPI00286E2831|nr:photosystem II protein PsbQ [Chamaesiphon sp. VAR_48_metabat_403]
MSLFRPLISLMLVLISVFVVSCGDGTQAKAPTYSTQQLAQIQTTNKNVTAISDRLPELASLIQERDWNNVKSFIHGPLGDIRTRMSGLSRELLPGSKEQALAISKEIFVHLNKIDEAANNNDYKIAIRNYGEALKDLASFQKLIPAA